MAPDEITVLYGKLEDLSNGQSSLDTKLSSHMIASAENSGQIRAELHRMAVNLSNAIEDTQKLYSSLPEDEHGRPSIFIHKGDHLDQALSKREQQLNQEDRRNISKNFLESVASTSGKLIVGIACAVVLGEKFPIIFKLVATVLVG